METEIITKSEAARRWGISPAAVGKYIGATKGMPVRPDGKLNWPAVDEWRRMYNVPEKSGSYQSRLSSGQPAAASLAGERGSDSDFITGFVYARASILQRLPALIATMRPAHVQDRIGVLAIVDHLLQSWLDTPENSKAAMPEIDWTVFTSGITPKRARELFEALQADFATAE